jgi:uncharacterized protein (DUF1015 family)
MADILPFIGTRYNSQLIGDLSKVVAPPYDIISPDQQDELYERHPNNVIRLELGRDKPGDDAFSNRFTRAANSLRTWRSDGILIEEDQPAIYLYEQEFRVSEKQVKKRRGFFALVRIDDAQSGRTKPDEQTFAGPKADRLKLMRATGANLSSIFAVYTDRERQIQEMISERMDHEKPWEVIVDEEQVVHRMWVVHKKEFIMKLREGMKPRRLFIADGHHRYETALSYRDEMREETGKRDSKQPFDYMMMYLTSSDQDGLVILPTHRALSRRFMSEVDLKAALEEIRECFDVQEGKVDLEKPDAAGCKIVTTVGKLGDKCTAIAMALSSGKVYYLRLKKAIDPCALIEDEDVDDRVKRLDVSILHNCIINQIFVGNPEFELEDDECSYVRDMSQVLNLLKSKKAPVAFVMNAIPIQRFMEIVGAGIRLPRKSGFFHPKIITGLVLRNMDSELRKSKPCRR